MEAGRLIEIAIEDVREKHKALFELIRFTDQQAMALLSLYTTLAVAAASGFGASLGKDAIIPAAGGAGLLAAAVALAAGSACCFRVLRSATISTPGRGPDFWIWAMENPGVDETEMLSSYLRQLEKPIATNRAVNASGTWWLMLARICGMAAPILAGGVAAAAWRAGL